MARNDRFERGYRNEDRAWDREDDRRWGGEVGSGRDYGWRGREEYDLARRERDRYASGAWTSQAYGGWSSREEGPHSGRGPRAWKRSDQRIEDDVHERLSRHGYIDASDITVEVKECEVTLKGKVASREEKRLAEDLVEGVFGVKDVHNDLKVEERAIEGHERTVANLITRGH